MKIEQVGVQLYTLRELTARDMPGTLRKLAEIGYQNVEFAGYGNSAVGDIRATLDEAGIRAIAAHVQLDRIEQDTERLLSEMETLGCQTVVVPSIGEEYRTSVPQVRRLVERLNRAGKRLLEAGVRLGYHNHQFEFAALDGTTMWELLVTETDPLLVDLELDVYWAVVGGFDPVDLLRRSGQRVRLLHLKDRAREAGRPDAPVGHGALVWEPILGAAAAGTQWYIVEQDYPQNPLEDVRVSFEQLQAWSEREGSSRE